MLVLEPNLYSNSLELKLTIRFVLKDLSLYTSLRAVISPSRMLCCVQRGETTARMHGYSV